MTASPVHTVHAASSAASINGDHPIADAGANAESCPLLRLHPDDNVATALVPISAGTVVWLPTDYSGANNAGGRPTALTVAGDIPFGHKVALAPITEGGEVRKYGEVIGRTTAAVAAGSHVHVHNVDSQRGRGDLHR